MQHPLFKNQKNILAYTIAWILIAGIHLLFLMQISRLSFQIAFVDSIVSNGLFYFLSLGLWYVMQYGIDSKKGSASSIIELLVSGAVFISLWLFLVYTLLSFITKTILETELDVFIRSSLPLRASIGLLFYGLIVLVYYLIVYYENLRQQTLQQSELNILLQESRLNVLRTQINPHFLFNSLNSVSSLTLSQPEKAHDLVIKLSEFLRYSLQKSDEKFTSFEQELYHTHQYIDIEKVRFGARLIIEQDIAKETLQLKIPVLLLQPLIENAIKHGVYSNVKDVNVKLKASVMNENLMVEISNYYEDYNEKPAGTGTGLANIRSRLQLIYHNDHLMKIEQQPQNFCVSISIPQHESNYN
ncbi:MAG: histidine kinase [Bacteroidota bacterium]